jgi:hypothetical protein
LRSLITYHYCGQCSTTILRREKRVLSIIFFIVFLVTTVVTNYLIYSFSHYRSDDVLSVSVCPLPASGGHQVFSWYLMLIAILYYIYTYELATSSRDIAILLILILFLIVKFLWIGNTPWFAYTYEGFSDKENHVFRLRRFSLRLRTPNPYRTGTVSRTF